MRRSVQIERLLAGCCIWAILLPGEQPGKDYYFPPQAAKFNGAVELIAVLCKEQLKQFPAPPDLPELSPRLVSGTGETTPWILGSLYCSPPTLFGEIFEGEKGDRAKVLSALDDGHWPEPFACARTRR